MLVKHWPIVTCREHGQRQASTHSASHVRVCGSHLYTVSACKALHHALGPKPWCPSFQNCQVCSYPARMYPYPQACKNKKTAAQLHALSRHACHMWRLQKWKTMAIAVLHCAVCADESWMMHHDCFFRLHPLLPPPHPLTHPSSFPSCQPAPTTINFFPQTCLPTAPSAPGPYPPPPLLPPPAYMHA